MLGSKVTVPVKLNFGANNNSEVRVSKTKFKGAAELTEELLKLDSLLELARLEFGSLMALAALLELDSMLEFDSPLELAILLVLDSLLELGSLLEAAPLLELTRLLELDTLASEEATLLLDELKFEEPK